jgi:predicted CoA-substrate-specific enzyme activase
MKTLGICLGASTVSLVQVEIEDGTKTHPGPDAENTPQILSHAVYPHDGNPRKALTLAMKDLALHDFDRIAATGRKFRNFVNLSSISEPESVEYAYHYVKPKGISCPAIVSAGGETFMAYVLNQSGRISNVMTGNKCASGTGEFFLQQIRRMGVSLEEAARWAVEEKPYHVSGRCSVFCKSDCTHATNKGTPKSKVTAGLCNMMADKILELLKNIERRHIMLTGGTVKNRMMVEYLRREIDELIVPEEGPFFEALGAALWAVRHETTPVSSLSEIFKEKMVSFDSLPPLSAFEDQVEFKSMETGQIRPGDICILGLDVGSTTTKAVLLRKSDDAMLASVYLRTNGDPVGASRKCYAAILGQVTALLDPSQFSIIGLGVCGSGRQIAGLHALTEGIINEIIAHATAAVYFDPQVDTIFEIGGQDAKYTYITNAVPSDYAMNEACSAGTGSFLEESALESLGLPMEEIAAVALKGKTPPNFNDQCAAFIASDIKNAIHEGIRHEDIVAGLVYSICMNYANRVKGNRPVGEKVFLQGGVCYNRAVPLAMASIAGKPIIVPPEPGLMGAFGVALAVKHRIETGLMPQNAFDLGILAERDVIYGQPFVCKGGKEKCDRRCTIEMIEIEGRRYPFGGACNRYYNLRHHVKYPAATLDLIRLRQQLIFEKYGAGAEWTDGKQPKGRIGFNRSFLVNTFFPLYSHFFSALGYQPVVPDTPSKEGIDRRNAAFCYPAELSHGFFHTLIQSDPPPDFIFLPHFKSLPVENGDRNAQVCPFVQGETFYLRTTFRKEIKHLTKKGVKILTPLLDLSRGLQSAREPLVASAAEMGIQRRVAEKAFENAMAVQIRCLSEMKAMGRKALADLEADSNKIGVVIFSRPYNGFVEEAHMGIPNKLASRGILVIPYDFLEFDHEKHKRHMYWGMGQMILKAARLVQRHPQLFGTFITNFSCGPDSFIIGYFRSIMGRKPSLTLELDSHTADAGLDTRIDAFIDIVTAFRQLVSENKIDLPKTDFRPAQTTLENGRPTIITSSGESVRFNDPRVTVLIPSMGKLGTEGLAAVFRGMGVNARPLPPADEAILKLGRGNTSCKECLPLILTTGALLSYVRNHKKNAEIVIYFMATGSGPCRFGQYYIFMEDLIKRLELPDVAILTLTSENSYLGMSKDFELRAWWAVILSDIMEDIRSMLLANAKTLESALACFDSVWENILLGLEKGEFKNLERLLSKAAATLAAIPLRYPVERVPTLSLTGEIFVRRDGLSRQNLTEKLAEKGFATVCSPVSEWVQYSEYLVENGYIDHKLPLLQKLQLKVRKKFMANYEKTLRSILADSGLIRSESPNIREIIQHALPYISPNLTGEAILTIGSSLYEIASHVCGVIAIGPFGCMPNRLSEAVLNEIMKREDRLAADPNHSSLRQTLQTQEELPFLSIESDGSPFPQLIHAKLEAFCLRAERLHARMMAAGNHQGGK